jgi:hypothetical protein
MKNNMKIKKSLSALFVLVLVLGVVSIINNAWATGGSYTAPTAPFPSCDSSVAGCNTPLNVSSLVQIKPGDLYVGANSANFISANGIATKAFYASQNSEFAQNVTVDQLSQASSDRSVCADTNGKLVLCNTPGAVSVVGGYNMKLQVSGINGFSQTTPTAGSYTGSHNGFTGPISVASWTNGATLPPSGVDVELLVNNAEKECFLVKPSSGFQGQLPSFQYDSFTYSFSDSISVQANSAGSCSTITNTVS